MSSDNATHAQQDGAESESDDEPSRYSQFRAKIAARPAVDRTYRIAVAFVGIAVLALGIVLIPYPGPGWVVVFTGLGILASEFAWAKRLLAYAKDKYDAFMTWFGKQSMFVRAIGVVVTTVVVLATLWLLGALGTVAGWVGLDQAWLQSPL